MLENLFARPLRLEIGGRQLSFATAADFEFALASRTEVPAAKVSALLQLDADALREEATHIRQIERHLVDVLSQSMEEPGTIGGLLRELDIKLFSQDHEWRDIIAALLKREARFDEFKQVALVKYVQYLAARQDVLRSLYQGRRRQRQAGSAQREAVSADSTPSLGETVIFDLSQSDAPDAGARLRRLPVGEPVRVKLPEDGELDIVLSRHPFKIVTGQRHYLVDEAGHDYPLRAGRNVVGRQPGNDVTVDGAYRDISRRHLVIEFQPGGELLLTDLSSHGTFLRAGPEQRGDGAETV